MLWGNLLFFLTSIGMILWLRENPPKREVSSVIDVTDAEFTRIDWIIAAVFLLVAAWMMFQTFRMEGDQIVFGHHQFPDFGSTLSIM